MESKIPRFEARDFGLPRCLLSEGVVAGTLGEEVVVRLDVRSEVNDFAARRFFFYLGIEWDTFLTCRHRVRRGDFLFNEDRFIWAFGDARTAVDAGIRIDEVPGPFIFRLTGNNAFHRENFNTCAVA